MKQLLTTILLGIPTTALFKAANFPSFALLMLLFMAMVIDLVTGVVKAYTKGEARTSSGLRKTIIKFLQYGGGISVSCLLSAMAAVKEMPKATSLLAFMGDGLVIFIIYIELTSICENLYAIDQASVFSRLVIKPLLRILTFQLKNNPSLKAIEDKDA